MKLNSAGIFQLVMWLLFQDVIVIGVSKLLGVTFLLYGCLKHVSFATFSVCFLVLQILDILKRFFSLVRNVFLAVSVTTSK